MSKDWTQEKAFEVLEGEITRLTAENEALANDRDGYVQLLTDQNNALTARVKELEGQHKGLVIQNALLRQRPDLPADRIPAARGVEALTARVAELERMLHRISLGSQNSGTTKEDLGREARAALTQPAEKGGE